jgi:hypothetical protein
LTNSLSSDKVADVSTPSRTYQLIEERLDGTLAEFVRNRRQPSTSWRNLAAEIHTLTGVDVSYETLRSWFAESDSEPAA